MVHGRSTHHDPNHDDQRSATNDLRSIGRYGDRPKTVLEHEWEIRDAYGYRDFTAAETEP